MRRLLARGCLCLLPLALAAGVQAEVLLSPPATVAKERHGRCAGVAAVVSLADGEQAWRLALERFQGVCRPRNHTETVRALQQAAALGHVCAIGALGLMQGLGWGTERDLPQARALIRQSMALGCIRAPYWGWRVETAAQRPLRSRVQAVILLEEGAQMDDGHALNALGAWHETQGLTAQAREGYARALARGNGTARYNLARLERLRLRGADRPALDLLKQQATDGDAQAVYLLARRLHAGDGVAVNHGEAIRRYQQAALLGDAASQEMLTLIRSSAGPSGDLDEQRMAALAAVELPGDQLNKARGVTQPLEDEDPFAGL